MVTNMNGKLSFNLGCRNHANERLPELVGAFRMLADKLTQAGLDSGSQRKKMARYLFILIHVVFVPPASN